MAELLLVARIAGRRIAFPASDVEAVVELDGIEPVPCGAGHVAGLSALRSRVLTVIDCLAALCKPQGQASDALNAIVLPSGGHTYALLVDEVEDVIESGGRSDLGAPLGDGWDAVASGMVDAEGDLLLLADPHAFIAGPAAVAA